MKKKIKLYLSDSDDERIYEIPNQYFYINCYKDNRFYDMVSNIFYEDDVLSNKQVMNELNKIIKTKLNLDSSRYTKNKLLDELKKIIYQLPLSIQFILKENSKNIIEYADIINNQIQIIIMKIL